MKQKDLNYPPLPSGGLSSGLERYSRLATEFGYGDKTAEILQRVDEVLTRSVDELREIVEHVRPDENEPESFDDICAQRPDGKRRMTDTLPEDYTERWWGAFLGRSAGCTLGAGLEFCSVEEMERWAHYCGDPYPLTDYWRMVKYPYRPRYILGCRKQLTKGHIDAIPVDDDLAYTLAGLLTLETYGPNFTHQQMAELWKERFPLQAENGSWGLFWGERNMVQNLHQGIPIEKAGYLNNPNVESIAAWTRADTWGYVAPGWPEKAAALAFKDASINHRRSGVYGSMFFAAVIAAAFVVDDPMEAISIGLQEIPKDSLFAEAVCWALRVAPNIKNYKDAATAIAEQYDGMFRGHAINNALCVIFGIHIGGKDFTKVIGETVAMGLDNDCTAATAGSIVGAVIGKTNIPKHWYLPFNNRMHCYLKGCPEYIDLDTLLIRYTKQVNALLA